MTDAALAAYHARMRPRATRHDDCEDGDCEECEDSEDCEDDEYCDEDEGECVEREDGADSIRRHLLRRYRVDASGVPAVEVARRAATILGVSIRGLGDAAAVALVSVRADAEWSEDDHPRAEDGKFSGDGGGGSRLDKVRSEADRASSRANASGKPEDHSKAAGVNQEAAFHFGQAGRKSEARALEQRANGHAAIANADTAKLYHRDFGTTPNLKPMADPAKASAKAHEASTSASTAADHSKAMQLHRQAEAVQRALGSRGAAQSHARAAEAHESAAQGLRVGFKASATKRYAAAAVTHSEKAVAQATK